MADCPVRLLDFMRFIDFCRNAWSSRLDKTGPTLSCERGSKPAGAIFISAWDALCRERDCLVRVPNGEGGESIMAIDQVHLTEAGSRFLIRALEPKLFGP